MKVKITKCSSNNYWYYNKIGEIFDVVDNGIFKGQFATLKLNGYFIDKNDCEIVEEETHEEQKSKGNENWEKDIDWEVTRKLNANQIPKEETKIEEEHKSKGYMIINPKGEVPKKIHATLIDAELEVKRLLSIQSNHEFIIVEIIERAKAETKVVWF